MLAFHPIGGERATQSEVKCREVRGAIGSEHLYPVKPMQAVISRVKQSAYHYTDRLRTI